MCRHYLFEISSHFIDKVYLYVKGWYILGNFLFNPFSTKQEIVLNFENEIRNERFIFFYSSDTSSLGSHYCIFYCIYFMSTFLLSSHLIGNTDFAFFIWIYFFFNLYSHWFYFGCCSSGLNPAGIYLLKMTSCWCLLLLTLNIFNTLFHCFYC